MIGDLAQLRAEHAAIETAKAEKRAKDLKATRRAFFILWLVLCIALLAIVSHASYSSGYFDGLAAARRK
jgi:hypothetical protein